MALRSRRLNEGEEVVLDLHPHWWYLAGPVATIVAVIAGAIAALAESAPPAAGWAVVAALVASAGWLLLRYLRWRTSRFILTTSRLIERRGVLSRTSREIPLMGLSDISYRQSLFERVIGAGCVLVESPGKDSPEYFPDLPRPARVQNEIFRLMDGVRKVQPVQLPPSHGSSIPEQIDQLDQLRRRGVISDADFEQKKAQLLDRM
ncbi:MAG TPA: PH domain-containing protein [Acidimicrobiales bacterium]|nr:PH domain-containing protein [Acidimicrobiales bacterium]